MLCHSLGGSIHEVQITLLIVVFVIKHKCMKKEEEVRSLLLFHPFLKPGHVCMTKLDVNWIFCFRKTIWLKKQPFRAVHIESVCELKVLSMKAP